MIWNHIWLCTSRLYNMTVLDENPHLLAMFEVCLDYGCLNTRHFLLDDMVFVLFHRCRVMIHFVPSMEIYTYIQVYSLLCVSMNFHCILYVFGLELRVSHSHEVGWMKVYLLYLERKGRP